MLVVPVIPHAYYKLSSVMLASQCWHTEDHFRLVASHRAMPSLCPLPSAVNTGGEAILLPREVSLRKRGSALVLVTAGLGSKNRFLVPKPPSWHLGVPGARHRHPLSSPAREWGWGMRARVQRVSALPRCPTGNDTQPCAISEPSPPQTDHERRSGGVARSWHAPSVFEWSLHCKTQNKKCSFGPTFELQSVQVGRKVSLSFLTGLPAFNYSISVQSLYPNSSRSYSTFNSINQNFIFFLCLLNKYCVIFFK